MNRMTKKGLVCSKRWSRVDGKELSGILAKSGPLDFATKNSFPLFFVCEKGLVHMYQNHFIYFPIFIFALLQAKNQFCPQRGFGGDQKAEIYGF